MGKFITSVHDHLILDACAIVTDKDRHLLQAEGRPVPPPVPIRLVIDTGSGRSSLIPSIIAHRLIIRDSPNRLLRWLTG